MEFSFQQVDVFSSQACMGNPVAVFLDSQGLSTEDMQKIARWTNLSETTFVSPSEKADYKVRIFTPSEELPFAGHPTLGTAYALKKASYLKGQKAVQECAFGLVNIEFQGDQVYFELPKFQDKPLSVDRELSEALGVSLTDSMLITTGPDWIVAELAAGKGVEDIRVDSAKLLDLFNKLDSTGVTVYAIKDSSVYVRTYFETLGSIVEDPVCGSGNAAVAVHILKSGNDTRVGTQYAAFQGQCFHRDGRISVQLGEKIKVGGACNTVFEGKATL